MGQKGFSMVEYDISGLHDIPKDTNGKSKIVCFAEYEVPKMKEKLWRAIEAYRQAGGREEHWARRDQLDHLIDEILTNN